MRSCVTLTTEFSSEKNYVYLAFILTLINK